MMAERQPTTQATIRPVFPPEDKGLDLGCAGLSFVTGFGSIVVVRGLAVGIAAIFGSRCTTLCSTTSGLSPILMTCSAVGVLSTTNKVMLRLFAPPKILLESPAYCGPILASLAFAPYVEMEMFERKRYAVGSRGSHSKLI